MDRYKSQGGVGLLDLRCGAVCTVEDPRLIFDGDDLSQEDLFMIPFVPLLFIRRRVAVL